MSTVNGTITESTVSSTITYTYNGLGQVLTKAEAAGDTVTYTYDVTGRLTKESRAAYTDHASASVTPTVEYLYNGLNNLSPHPPGRGDGAGGRSHHHLCLWRQRPPRLDDRPGGRRPRL